MSLTEHNGTKASDDFLKCLPTKEILVSARPQGRVRVKRTLAPPGGLLIIGIKAD